MTFWHIAAIAGLTLVALMAASVGRISTELTTLRMIFEVIYHDDLYAADQVPRAKSEQPTQVIQ